MRVVVIQSGYLPWRGYFDLIGTADLFLFHDDIQYTKQDWRNRNRIKTAASWRWLTVPVRRHSAGQRIDEIEISYDADWRREHLNQLAECYGKAPHFRVYRNRLDEILALRPQRLSELNQRIIHWLAGELGVATPLRRTAELAAVGSKTDRLVDILTKVGATTYLSGPAAKAYIEVDKFRRAGIGLEFKTYDYAPYPQQWGAFTDHMSVIDLLMNVGDAAALHLRSARLNEVVLAPGGLTPVP
ncbi:WbqC family protein [Azospirillum sp. ST 5-10]|uniref:WbqC family protein n=1 Tax=unclassified Azospirillum TaxID=2630922 RepID=UPI003F4A0366